MTGRGRKAAGGYDFFAASGAGVVAGAGVAAGAADAGAVVAGTLIGAGVVAGVAAGVAGTAMVGNALPRASFACFRS